MVLKIDKSIGTEMSIKPITDSWTTLGREKLKYVFMVLILFLAGQPLLAQDIVYFVANNGNDHSPGTIDQPFATWQKARDMVRKLKSNEKVTVYFRGGTYYLDKPLIFGPEDSGSDGAPVTYQSYHGEKVMISGAQKLPHLKWVPWNSGIYKVKIPESVDFDQLFINGKRQIRARFPNYDDANPLRGGLGYELAVNGSNKRYDTWLEFNPELFSHKSWSDPSTGIVHGFQSHNWGNLEYHVKGMDRKTNRILLGKGGWQLQRAYGIGKGSPFYVENIFEELDAPGEWFFNTQQRMLYYYPPAGVRIDKAIVEVVVLKNLVTFKGTETDPVKNIQLKGLSFTQARMTFMEPYEPVGRGDWAIYQGGTVYMEGVEDCGIDDCDFEYLGGNGVFMSKYNRRNIVSGCRFYHMGESAVCFVGDTSAVRDYLTWDDKDLYGKDWGVMSKNMDRKPGPKTPNYPDSCVVENCVASDLGDFGKQVAGVFISMSHQIRVSHTTIYNVPRAAICINDGTWGGHIIEYCDIWNTVRETGEHGPFNSWGRDRSWPYGNGRQMPASQVLLDPMDPVIIRNNRIANLRKAISAGNWAIDLDDGSSNYEIYDNLCLGSTLKLRDGYFRKVWNNIFISAVPMGWHVWPDSSGDEFFHNIMVIAGAVPGTKQLPTRFFIGPISMPGNIKWGKRIDDNLYYNANYENPQVCPDVTIDAWQKRGYDQHSVFTNPLFIDPERRDYRVNVHSPALGVGFKNFPMDQFGHTMTRMEPFEGEFENGLLITLEPDERGGKLYYTLDGSEPSENSTLYTAPFKINKTDTVRAQTFNHGIPVGFEAKGVFKKVDKVTYPSWYQALLYEKPSKVMPAETITHQKAAMEWKGARLTDIMGGDMVDAMGGFKTGVFMEDVPASSEAYRLGFRTLDIMLKWNGLKINNIKGIRKLINIKSGKKVQITVTRGYDQIMLEATTDKEGNK